MFDEGRIESKEYVNDKLETNELNLFTGTNSSGKSTILQSLLLLAQNLENSYHGFVLGLLVELKDWYNIKSNRESGTESVIRVMVEAAAECH